MYSSDIYMAEGVASATMNSAPMMGLFLGIMIFTGVLSLILIISNWKIFNKAGKPGWASIIPIYNYLVMIQIAKLSLVYLLLLLIPIVNIFAVFKINIEIAKKFGKSTGFGLGMTIISIIFIPLLAFSDNVYEDSQRETNENNPNDINLISKGNEQGNYGGISSNIETVNNDLNINQPSIMSDENIQQNIVEEQQIQNEISNIEDNKTGELVENIPAQEINKDVPVINEISNDNMVVNSDAMISGQDKIKEVPSAFNSRPLEMQSEVEETPSLNIDINNSINLEENINEVPTPEIVPQIITEIPVVNESVNPVEQKKVCKNCGEILPNIVSICPKCGTDNE